jgi:hypothetical protein
MAGVVILAGHYIDFFNMIMPGTVGDRWFIEFQKLLLFFLPWIIYCFLLLQKNPLLPKRNPFIDESKHFIINKKKTDDKFVGNYSFSFISCCFMAID